MSLLYMNFSRYTTNVEALPGHLKFDSKPAWSVHPCCCAYVDTRGCACAWVYLFEQLAATAGLEVLGSTVQRMQSINPRTYVGSGKVEEISQEVDRLKADTVTPSMMGRTIPSPLRAPFWHCSMNASDSQRVHKSGPISCNRRAPVKSKGRLSEGERRVIHAYGSQDGVTFGVCVRTQLLKPKPVLGISCGTVLCRHQHKPRIKQK